MGGCQSNVGDEALELKAENENKNIIKLIDKIKEVLIFNIPPKDRLLEDSIHFLQGGFEEVHNQYINKPIIWVIGNYKVGKSLLINQIFDKSVTISDSHVNTRGELHYIHQPKVDDKISLPCVVVDTQGFDQILSMDDPEYVKDFIVSHLSNFNSILILVIPKLSAQELSFIHHIIFTIGSKVNRFIIVHNLHQYETRENLFSYRNQLIYKFRIDEKTISRYPIHTVEPFFLDHELNGVRIRHIIGGQLKKGLFKPVVEFIRNEINNINYSQLNFLQGIIETFKQLLLKYFSANHYKIVVDKTIRCSAEDYKLRKINHGTWNSQAIVEWSNFQNGTYIDTVLEYSLAKFKLRSFRILDDTTIMIKGEIKSRYDTQEIVQQISTPFKIYRGSDAHHAPKYIGSISETTLLVFHPSVDYKADLISLPEIKDNMQPEEKDNNYIDVQLLNKSKSLVEDGYITFQSCSLKCMKIDLLLRKNWDCFNQKHDMWLKEMLAQDTYIFSLHGVVVDNPFRVDIDLVNISFSLYKLTNSIEELVPPLGAEIKLLMSKIVILTSPTKSRPSPSVIRPNSRP